MGLRDRLRRDDGAGVRRYQLRERLMSIGDDYWIEDESGQRAFKVDGKALRVRDTFVLRDAADQEAAKIQERKVRVRDTMEIERSGGNATVHKAIVGVRDRFKIDIEGGPDMSAHGNIVDHEYEIERDGDTGRHSFEAVVPGQGNVRGRNRAGPGRRNDPGHCRVRRCHESRLTSPSRSTRAAARSFRAVP